jgi:hypothetical protein
MSTPKQGDTIGGGGENLYRNESEILDYGFTPIDGKIWSGIFPCIKEKCMAWDTGLVRLQCYDVKTDFCKGCTIWNPDYTCSEWESGKCPVYDEPGCKRLR